VVNFRLTCKVSRQSNRISLFFSCICIKCYKLKRVHQPAEFLHFIYPTAALVFGQSATAMRLADWPFWLAGGSAVQWRRSERLSLSTHCTVLYRSEHRGSCALAPPVPRPPAPTHRSARRLDSFSHLIAMLIDLRPTERPDGAPSCGDWEVRGRIKLVALNAADRSLAPSVICHVRPVAAAAAAAASADLADILI